VEVRDWPAFAYRSLMIDMNHGPLPTEAEVKRQIDFPVEGQPVFLLL
jgi:N-acetyl-beta-hexosaminidase